MKVTVESKSGANQQNVNIEGKVEDCIKVLSKIGYGADRESKEDTENLYKKIMENVLIK
ncbi:hypothetical protein LbDm2_0794 [Levilactobacillus brevis]|nr:hypothetical protein LbDm2_0794 [Levilactobacillus brevis]